MNILKLFSDLLIFLCLLLCSFNFFFKFQNPSNMDEQDTFLEENLFSDESGDGESDIDISSFIASHTSRVMHLSSSEDSDDDNIPMDWTDEDIPRNNNPFEGEPGVKIIPDNTSSVEDVAGLFIGNDLFEKFAFETNKYREQTHHKYKKIDHTVDWVDVTVKELKRWFGLVIIMGLVRKGTLNDFWSTNKYMYRNAHIRKNNESK